MKTRQPNSRKIKIRQSLSGAFVIFVMGSFIPLLGAFLVGNGSGLICQRTKLYEGKCELVRRRSTLSFDVSTLMKAKVNKSDERDGETGEYCYLPAIEVREKGSSTVFLLTPSVCSEFLANRVVSEINYFISTPTETELVIHQADWKEVLLYSTPFLLMSLLMSALVARESFSNSVFDLDRNCLTIIRKKWFRTTNVEEYSLNEIAAVTLETYDNGMSFDNQVIIKLKDGKEIALPSGDRSPQRLVFTLRQFLDL